MCSLLLHPLKSTLYMYVSCCLFLVYCGLIDVRELVELEDVMEAEDLKLGPNGGLVFCME